MGTPVAVMPGKVLRVVSCCVLQPAASNQQVIGSKHPLPLGPMTRDTRHGGEASTNFRGNIALFGRCSVDKYQVDNT